MISFGSYRYHALSTLSRGVFVNLGWLFAGSLFISEYGGEFYAPLHFLASILTICCYFMFMGLSIRGAQIGYVVAFSLAVFFTLRQWVGVRNDTLALAFCVGILVIDLVGATISGNLLQAAVNPSIFKRIYQKIISVELLTRLLCTIFFFLLSKYDQLVVCFPVMAGAALLHGFSMLRIRMELPDHTENQTERPLSSVLQAVKFVKGNPLVKLALLITVWTYTMKFLGENLYYQAVESRFASQAEVGAFLSQLSFGLILLALAFKKLFADRLVENRTPSQLFFILPMGVLVTLLLALFAPPFWPIVAMYVFFMSINRGLQLPVSRQCLVPVPDSNKHAIVTLIFLISGAASIVISGSLTVLKDYMEASHYVYLMIFLTLPIFVALLNVDTYYVRNLWSMYRERVSGFWVEDLWASPSLSLRARFRRYHDVFDEEFWVTKEGSGLAERAFLVAGYKAESEKELRETVTKHRRLLASSDPDEVKAGIAVICETGCPFMQPELRRLTSHSDPDVSRLANAEIRVQEALEGLNTSGLRSHSKRKLKALLHHYAGSAKEEEKLEKLHLLLRLHDRRAAAKVLDALNFCRTSPKQLELCWQVIDPEGLTIMPLIETMLAKSYPRAAAIREIFLLTDLRDHVDHELEAGVATILTELTSKYFSVWTRKSSEIQWQSHFQHAMFLEEFRLRKHSASDAVIDSIDGLFECSYDDKLILCNMHLEVLKSSQFQFAWTTILDPNFYMQRTQFNDRTVRKFRLIESLVPESKKKPISPRRNS